MLFRSSSEPSAPLPAHPVHTHHKILDALFPQYSLDSLPRQQVAVPSLVVGPLQHPRKLPIKLFLPLLRLKLDRHPPRLEQVRRFPRIELRELGRGQRPANGIELLPDRDGVVVLRFHLRKIEKVSTGRAGSTVGEGCGELEPLSFIEGGEGVEVLLEEFGDGACAGSFRIFCRSAQRQWLLSVEEHLAVEVRGKEKEGSSNQHRPPLNLGLRRSSALPLVCFLRERRTTLCVRSSANKSTASATTELLSSSPSLSRKPARSTRRWIKNRTRFTTPIIRTVGRLELVVELVERGDVGLESLPLADLEHERLDLSSSLGDLSGLRFEFLVSDDSRKEARKGRTIVCQ